MVLGTSNGKINYYYFVVALGSSLKLIIWNGAI